MYVQFVSEFWVGVLKLAARAASLERLASREAALSSPYQVDCWRRRGGLLGLGLLGLVFLEAAVATDLVTA